MTSYKEFKIKCCTCNSLVDQRIARFKELRKEHGASKALNMMQIYQHCCMTNFLTGFTKVYVDKEIGCQKCIKQVACDIHGKTGGALTEEEEDKLFEHSNNKLPNILVQNVDIDTAPHARPYDSNEYTKQILQAEDRSSAFEIPARNRLCNNNGVKETGAGISVEILDGMVYNTQPSMKCLYYV